MIAEYGQSNCFVSHANKQITKIFAANQVIFTPYALADNISNEEINKETKKKPVMNEQKKSFAFLTQCRIVSQIVKSRNVLKLLVLRLRITLSTTHNARSDRSF